MITDNLKKIQERLASTLRTLPAILGEQAVDFSLNSFDQQAWSGHTQEAWKKRKNPTKWGKQDDTGRALLIQTEKLRRSIRVIRITNYVVYIGAGGPDTPYARAHNEGFSGQVNQNVKAFTRKMRNGKTQNVKAHKRTIFQNIPKRKFIGNDKDSPELKAILKKVTIEELKKIIK